MRKELPYVALSVLLVAALHIFFALPLGYTALAIFVGWPVIGTLVTLDDDLPGGFSNPDGSVKPPWLMSEMWGYLALRASLAALAFEIEAIVEGSDPLVPLVCIVVLVALGWVLVNGFAFKRPAGG